MVDKLSKYCKYVLIGLMVLNVIFGIITIIGGESSVALANPAFPGKATLAVYTDWPELNKWADAPKDENGTVQTIILKFPDIVHLTAEPGINGCVINAFGPTSFFMPTSMIDMITSLEGYKREFGDSPKTDN